MSDGKRPGQVMGEPPLSMDRDDGDTGPFREGRTLLVFQVAGQRYALSVGDILRIVEMVAISQLPQAPAFVAGVVNFRGQVIPVLDLRRRFQLPACPYTLRTPIVIGRLHGRVMGLIVDEVQEVVQVRPEQIAPTGQVLGELMGRQVRYVSAVARSDEGLLLLLDPPSLLTPGEAAFLQVPEFVSG